MNNRIYKLVKVKKESKQPFIEESIDLEYYYDFRKAHDLCDELNKAVELIGEIGYIHYYVAELEIK
jgi:hypothetical protein